LGDADGLEIQIEGKMPLETKRIIAGWFNDLKDKYSGQQFLGFPKNQ
jgi:hypothetical protein